MRAGDVVFFKAQDPVGGIISFLTGSPFSHVGLAIAPKKIIEANRFIKTRQTTFVPDPEKHSIFRVPGLTESQRLIIIAAAKNMTGKEYDYFQIFGFLLRLAFGIRRDNLFNRANLLICSEVIDRAFIAANVPRKSTRKPGDLTPGELLRAYEFREV